MQETPETRAKLANAISTLRSQGREGDVASLVSQYKAKYRPELAGKEAAVALSQPAKSVFKTLENAGQGAALSIGNLGTGIVGGALKLVGADKAAQRVEDFRQKGYVQPTVESQKTFAGKTGKVATDVLSYMTPGGLPARVGTSALVGFGQSGGDVKAGATAGVIEGLTGGLSKLPGAKTFVGKVAKTLAPGYTSDVVQGLAGQRGEDRTGAAAFLPGAGTAFSGVLGAGAKGVKTVKKIRNPQFQLDEAAKQWEVPTNAKNAKFDKAKEIELKAKAKGFDVKQELAQNKVFLDKNIVDGKYNTADVADTFRKDAGGGSSYLDEAIKLKNASVLREPSKNIYEQAIKTIDPTTTEGDRIIKYLQKEAKLQKPEFDFTDIYNKKKYYGSNAKWKMGMPGDGVKEQANAALDRVLKNKLVQKGKEAGIPVEDFLSMQEQKYKVADYLDSLDGARVPATPGQKIRRGVLKTAGALVGAKGGPYGAVAGYHGGGLIDSLLGDMPKPLRDAVLKDYSKATPQVQKQMEQVIADTVAKNKAMKALPAPTTIYSNTRGTPNSTGFTTSPIVETVKQSYLPLKNPSVANPTTIPNNAVSKNAIPTTLPPKKKFVNKQGGFVINPLVRNVKIKDAELGEMRDFLDIQSGSYKPEPKLVIKNEADVRAMVEARFGKEVANLSTAKLKNYVNKIVDKYWK